MSGFKTITTVASTIPANGELNPYGVAVVTHRSGMLHKGDAVLLALFCPAAAAAARSVLPALAPITTSGYFQAPQLPFSAAREGERGRPSGLRPSRRAF